tara:strand:+ start:138 stop:380 length:243 start_codon:yes stop_codon:yes gene_type:complete
MFKIEDGVIHGSSFAVKIETVEFLTWRLNEESSMYWVKFHLPSGKEIRIQVEEESLRDIVDEWGNGNIDLDLVNNNGLDY